MPTPFEHFEHPPVRHARAQERSGRAWVRVRVHTRTGRGPPADASALATLMTVPIHNKKHAPSAISRLTDPSVKEPSAVTQGQAPLGWVILGPTSGKREFRLVQDVRILR